MDIVGEKKTFKKGASPLLRKKKDGKTAEETLCAVVQPSWYLHF